jgi:ferric-dicitrate binding protein FerR (iron transport regulator)
MTNNRVWILVARKLSGEASLEELRELEQLLRENRDLAYQVELYTALYENPSVTLRSDEERNLSWRSASSLLREKFPESFNRQAKGKLRRLWIRWSAVAAALVAIVATILYLSIRDEARKPATAVNEWKTMPGTRTKMVLPDGTQVWLNSDSYLTYNNDFGKAKREITLSGEAFFDVFHNPEVPLVVHAQSVNILVKGTAFNVRSYPEAGNVETSLIRGSVQLTTNTDPSRIIMLKPNEKITIETNAILPKTSHTPKPTHVYHIDVLKESALSKTIPEISWVQNKLVFDNEPFEEVLNKMGKWYNAEFILNNEGLMQKKFSGAFDKETLYEALSALQMINYFEFDIRGNKVYIK